MTAEAILTQDDSPCLKDHKTTAQILEELNGGRTQHSIHITKRSGISPLRSAAKELQYSFGEGITRNSHDGSSMIKKSRKRNPLAGIHGTQVSLGTPSNEKPRAKGLLNKD